jgi:5-methylcytosine-specific restriction endonuclease McrA
MRDGPLNHAALSDPDLLLEVRRLASHEREATARLIAVLGELDARRLYLAEGCSSLFTYCTHVLHLSEHAAYGRIEAARAARKWPIVLELLADGSVHLTAVALLSRHLTAENHQDLLAAAQHKSKREVEEIVAALRPQPAVASTVRKLPAPKAIPTEVPMLAAVDAPGTLAPRPTQNIELPERALAPLRRPVEIKPLAPEQYKVQFTVSRETYDKLRQAQDLLRHRIPNGDVAVIVDRALTLLLAELHRTKHAAVDRPRVSQPRRANGRHIPAAVRRAVWDRDGGQCAFVGATGRCSERGFLEYHHVVPFTDGGAAAVDNLELRCRAHNAYETERWFGVREEDLVREARGRYDAQPASR